MHDANLWPADWQCPTELPAGHQIPAGLTYSTVRPDLDFESYSEAGKVINLQTGKVTGKGLSEVGTPVYAEHPSCDVLCFSYDLKDGLGKRRWVTGMPDPQDLLDHVARGGDIAAHNATFEFWIWNMICVRKYGWPPLQLEQLYCDMAKARRFSLPAALAKLCQVLGTAEKDKRGQQLIRELCMPTNLTKNKRYFRRTPATDWDKFVELYDYCDGDIHSEACAAALVPDLTEYERTAWLNDQRINARGVQVDIESLDACLRVLCDAEKMYTMELCQITQGAVGSVSEVAKMVAYCHAQGLSIDNMQAETIKDKLAKFDKMEKAANDPATFNAMHAVDQQDVGKYLAMPHVKRVLEIRAILGGANVKKLYTFKRMVSSDGRLRDQYVYCGADRTGRASAGGVQLQNITAKGPKTCMCESCNLPFVNTAGQCPRCGSADFWHKLPEWTVEQVEVALADIRRYDGGLRGLVNIWGDPAAVLAGCLRGLLTAKEGHELMCCDFSAIEAVVLACLSRCQWRIDVFNTHGKIYEMSASKITGLPFEEFAKYKAENKMDHPFRKSIGKVAELACFTRDTQVLTKRGYVRMVEVTKNDYLWDGITWVTSNGVIAKGKRETLVLDGVGVTPDHPVSLNGSWTEAKKLVLSPSMLSQALATGSENLPSFVLNAERANAVRGCSAFAGVIRTLSRFPTCTKGSRLGVLRAAVSKAVKPTLNSIQSMLTLYKTASTAGGLLTGYGLRSPAATVRTMAATRTTAAEGSASAMNGEGWTVRERFYSMLSHLAGGTTQALKWIALKQTATTSKVTYALSLKAKTPRTSAACQKCSAESTTLNDVYDIVNAGPRHRFTIKTGSGHLIVHNSGYGGWVGAWTAFGADKHFKDEAEIKEKIIAWREASPEIVEFWGGQHRQVGAKPWDSVPELFGLEGAVVAAIQSPGQCFHYIDVSYAVYNDVLYCRLPSGRFLHYHKPRLTAGVDHFRRPSQKITFWGWNSNSQKGPIGWILMETYGGRLAENVTQAVAADIQFEAIDRLETYKYPVVMHTHDEASSEKQVGVGSVEEMTAIMIERPEWASWWPIRAAGWHGKRYRKD